ncbi:MAG: NAD(P)H-hydrate epimerase, partial [Bacteroidetes bacterium]
MKILYSEQVNKLDAYTIDNEPILSINLMERAAKVCTDWIVDKFKHKPNVKIFVGPGNNGGDGLAIARMLADNGFLVNVFLKSTKLSKDAQINYDRILAQKRINVSILKNESDFPKISESDIVIDALFGSGLTRPVEGFYEQIIEFINNSKATIVSIDIPSGFFSEDNSKLTKADDGNYPSVIKAHYTLTLELPFLSFFFPDSQFHVGEWHCLSIGLSKTYLAEIKSDNVYLTKSAVKKVLKKRQKFDHKGTYGHALLIAGSYGKMGAAVLAARACLKTGIGLLSTHFPISGYEIMQTAVPEAMVCIDESGTRFCKSDEQDLYQAIGIGPG